MSRSLFVVFLALAVGAANQQEARQPELPIIPAGADLKRAPDFDLSDLDGERVRLSKIEAPVVLLHFWSKYRSCIDDLKLLDRLNKKYKGRGVVIIGLAWSSGSREEVAEFLGEQNVDIPVLMCSREVSHAYDVATFPTTFLLDRDRRVRYWMYGIMVERHWDKIIQELLDD